MGRGRKPTDYSLLGPPIYDPPRPVTKNQQRAIAALDPSQTQHFQTLMQGREWSRQNIADALLMLREGAPGLEYFEAIDAPVYPTAQSALGGGIQKLWRSK